MIAWQWMRLVVLLVMLGGCHKLFDLEQVKLGDTTGDGGTRDGNQVVDAPLVDASRACPATLEFDEDGDSIDDRCDACPTIQSDSLDEDGDGLPNACDKNLAPEDAILFWTTFFDPSELGAFTHTKTSWDDNTVGLAQIGMAGSMTMVETLTPLEIEVNVVDINASTTGTLTLRMTTSVGCEITASACDANDGSKSCMRMLPDRTGEVFVGLPASMVYRVRLYEAGGAWCTFLAGGEGNSLMSLDSVGTGNVRLETNGDASAQITSIVVYGAK